MNIINEYQCVNAIGPLLALKVSKKVQKEVGTMSVSFQKIEAILDRFPPQPEHLISALQDVQAKFNYIPPAAMRAVCDHLGVPISRGWAVATFYNAFSLEPKGEHEINGLYGHGLPRARRQECL